MSDIIEPEEIQAILDAVDPGAGTPVKADVQPRNFHQPRRLSRQRLQYLSQLVNASLQGVCRDAGSLLREHHRISLASISEVNVLGLFKAYEPPFVVNTFECGGHVSWMLWDSIGAAAAVETILSGPPALDDLEAGEGLDVAQDHGPRRLSQSECRVIERLLLTILTPVTGAFGLEITGGRLAQELEELTTLEDCGPDADARRLMLHFVFEGPGGPSDIRMYLPDVGEEDLICDGASTPQATPLPEHLTPVGLDVSAYLASVDVPLSDLMALEVGDVIPLGVEIGTPVELYIEDQCCARASWGRHHGMQAIQVEALDPHPGTITEPEDKIQ